MQKERKKNRKCNIQKKKKKKIKVLITEYKHRNTTI